MSAAPIQEDATGWSVSCSMNFANDWIYGGYRWMSSWSSNLQVAIIVSSPLARECSPKQKCVGPMNDLDICLSVWLPMLNLLTSQSHGPMFSEVGNRSFNIDIYYIKSATVPIFRSFLRSEGLIHGIPSQHGTGIVRVVFGDWHCFHLRIFRKYSKPWLVPEVLMFFHFVLGITKESHESYEYVLSINIW